MRDPLSFYIPEFANLKVIRAQDAAIDDTVPLDRPPTVEDSMVHTAGFLHGGGTTSVDKEYLKANVFGVDVSLAQMMEKLSKIPLAYQPGTRFDYSVGPDIQARLVEVLSGIPFDRFLELRLFQPLGMKDTGFWLGPDKARRLATTYWDKDGRLTAIDGRHGYPAGDFLAEAGSVNSYTVNHRRKGGSYGLVGTAEDYWRFAQMIANGGIFEGKRILSPSVVRYMTCNHLGSIAPESLSDHGRPTGMGWGLGFAVLTDEGNSGYMGSKGTLFWGGAANTLFWIDPQKDLIVVAMSQSMGTPKAFRLWGDTRTLVYSSLLD